MRKVFTYFKSLASLGLVTSLGLLGTSSCGDSKPPEMQMMNVPVQGMEVVSTPPDVAFNHDGTLATVSDVFADGQQLPVEESERLHACGKIHYTVLGNILKKRGVNTAAGTMCTDTSVTPNVTYPCTAGSLYAGGANVLGQANYPIRSPESERSTTGGIVQMQDLMIAAAEEILTASPDGTFGATTDCAGSKLFDLGTGGAPTTCNADGFACYVGVPLTPSQLSLCNLMLTDTRAAASTTPPATAAQVAMKLTLAAVASTIYLCD